MTAKLISDDKDTLRRLSDHLSYLQGRTEALSKVLARASKKNSQSERNAIEESSHTLTKLSQRLSDLHSNLRGGPSNSTRARLSPEASTRLFTICQQCDGLLDTINSTRSATSIQHCTTFLRVVSLTVAVASQCLKHARFLDDPTNDIDGEQQKQSNVSRARLERYVTEQQVLILRCLANDAHVSKERRNSQPDARSLRQDLSPETLLALLQDSLHRPKALMYAKIGLEQVEDVVELYAQEVLIRWVTRVDLNNVRPVVFTQPVQPSQSTPRPKRNRSSMPETVLERLISPPHMSRLDTGTLAAMSKSRRHSTTTTSPVMMGTAPVRRQSHSQASPFQPSSFPPSSLRDPPFVVTHARATAQARLNAQAQASIQAQVQARRASTSSSNNHPHPHRHHRSSIGSSNKEDTNTSMACPSSPTSETSSLAPTSTPADITIVWRLNALGHQWDFENEALVHNTSTLSPRAATSDRYATTEIRKSLLTPEAITQILGAGVRWHTVERRVVNGDKSQRKKFVSVEAPLEWREIEALVRRSGELCD